MPASIQCRKCFRRSDSVHDDLVFESAHDQVCVPCARIALLEERSLGLERQLAAMKRQLDDLASDTNQRVGS